MAKLKQSFFWGLMLIIILLMLIFQVSRSYFATEEQEIRNSVRQSFEKQFQQLAEASKQKFGLKQLNYSAENQKQIILIHGLDDPGKVWMNLAPYLSERSYNVWIMTYPNDQPIRKSAELFHQELVELNDNSSSNLVIIAHSMGGLVAREVLTNQQFNCLQPQCKIPAVKKLIMLGTPNHGSELARFREFAEVREQIARSIEGTASWLDWIFDGAGEAGIDLTPGSHFLTELNDRLHPQDTDYYVIAGVIADTERKTIRQNLTASFDSEMLPDVVDSILETIGDGLVSLESAKLEGVPLTIVSGTHLSMIRNLTSESQRLPPAIPVVMGILESN